MNLSLRRRVQVAFGLSVLLILAIGWATLGPYHRYNREVLKLQLAVKREMDEAGAIHDRFLDLYVTVSEAGWKAEARASSRAAADKIALDLDGLIARGSAPLYRALRTSVEKVRAELGQKDIRSDELRDAFRDAARALELFRSRRREEYRRLQRASRTYHEKIERNVLLTVVIGILCGLAVFLFWTPDLGGPVKRFLAALREIREANYGARVTVPSGHELGEVADAFNATLDGLAKLEAYRSGELLRERASFRTLAGIVDEAVVCADGKQKITFMNNRAFAFFGLASDEVIEERIDAIPLPEPVRTALLNAINKGTRANHHKVVVRPSPSAQAEVEIYLSTAIIEGTKKHPAIVVLTFRPTGPSPAWPAPA